MHEHRSDRLRFAELLSIALLATVLAAPTATAATARPAVTDVALLTVGATATITVGGKAHAVPKLGGVTTTARETPSGALLVADNMLKLIAPSGKVAVLSGKATVDGFAVSPDGRDVAWSVSPGSYRDKSPYKLFLYDLRLRKVVHSRLMPDQVAPVGFLDDGRVGIQADGLSHQSYLWRPSTGALRKVGTHKFPSVDQASGHLLVLSDQSNACSVLVEDTRTGRTEPLPTSAQCVFLQGLSPDETRWWSLGLNVIGDRLVAAPGVNAAVNGDPDLRLKPLFFERMGVTDGMWLDNDHLLLVAQAYKPGATVGRQLEELCAVPLTGEPSCSTVKDLGPYERPQDGGPGPSIGPDVYLVHPLGR